MTWGVTSVADEDMGVGTSTNNGVRKWLKRKQQPLTGKIGIHGQEYDCWQSSSSMAWCGIIPDQAALAQVKYESDSVGSYWANQAASHWPCTTDQGCVKWGNTLSLEVWEKEPFAAARLRKCLDAPRDAVVAGWSDAH